MREVRTINENYEKKDVNILLEQYKIIVDSAENVTDKRQKTNKFYLAAQSLLIAIAGYLTSIKFIIAPVVIAAVGILVSSVWYRNINSYRTLNNAKFKVIHRLEQHLPANLYSKEHEHLKRSRYYGLTSCERYVPFLFGILYILIIICSLLITLITG